MNFPKTSIVILAAGYDSSHDHDINYVQRHLKLKSNGDVLIGSVINTCMSVNCPIYIVIDRDNFKLKQYVTLNYPTITILYPNDRTIISTFRAALSTPDRCLMVSGDLLNVSSQHLSSFLNSKYECANCLYEMRWGRDIVSKQTRRRIRANIGPSIILVSVDYKKHYLSQESINRAEILFREFYPNGNQFNYMNPYVFNDYGTFINLAHLEQHNIDNRRTYRVVQFIKSLFFGVPSTIETHNVGLVKVKGRLFEDVDN